MNAVHTAREVISWAAAGGVGPPPTGPLRGADELPRAGDRLGAALRELLAVTAARLRLGCPPLGDTSPLTSAAAVLAAIVGGHGALSAELAATLVTDIVGSCKSVNDLVTRHALVGPAVAHLPSELAEECRRASPLTGLLERPGAGSIDDALRIAQRLHAYPRWRAYFALALGRPTDRVEVLLWRRELLNRFRQAGTNGRPFVLDVYEATMVYHAAEALAQVRAAEAVLDDERAMADDARLGLALAVAGWWGPLDELRRTHGAELRRRRYLGYDYRKGIALYQRTRTAS